MATKKQTQAETITFLSRIILALTIVLGIGFVGVAICCAQKPKISHLEQREMEAFETLFYNYVSEVPFLEDNSNATAAITNIGLSQDDDLYADIEIYYHNDNHEIVATQKGKMYFQCDHENRRIIREENKTGCGMAYSWEEKVPVEN